jgi:hypothetical protein
LWILNTPSFRAEIEFADTDIWYAILELWRTDRVGEDGKTAVDALEKGLDDLMALCEVVEDKFRVALDEKKSSMDID